MFRCKMCGRKLTNKNSIIRGLGLVCWGKVKMKINQKPVVMY